MNDPIFFNYFSDAFEHFSPYEDLEEDSEEEGQFELDAVMLLFQVNSALPPFPLDTIFRDSFIAKEKKS